MIVCNLKSLNLSCLFNTDRFRKGGGPSEWRKEQLEVYCSLLCSKLFPLLHLLPNSAPQRRQLEFTLGFLKLCFSNQNDIFSH